MNLKHLYIHTCLLCLALVIKPAIADEQVAIGKLIGWQHDSAADNLCHGYYREPLLAFQNLGLTNVYDSQITADSVSLSAKGYSILRGNVTVKQPKRLARADQAYVYRNPTTGKIDRIKLIGHVKIREPGKLLRANKASIHIDNNFGEITHIIYRFARNKQFQAHGIESLYGSSIWGTAERAAQTDKNQYLLQDATFASCPPGQLTWHIEAKKITLDKNKDKAYAHDVSFWWKDTRLLNVPYFSFPISAERKTGFLVPTLSFNTKSGAIFGLPFYMNLAPNYDFTFNPRYLSKRGVLYGGHWRYLSPYTVSSAYAEVIPHDRAYSNFLNDNSLSGSNTRGQISIDSQTHLNPYLSSTLIINSVSDDNYLQDFANHLSATTDRQLLQLAQLQYLDEHWLALGRAQHYQTLNPPGQVPVMNAFARLPQAIVEGDFPGLTRRLDFNLESEVVNFVWTGSNASITRGLRAHVAPTFQVPMRDTFGYFIPGVQLDLTHYELSHQTNAQATEISRALPLINVDAGLYFDRQTRWGDTPYLQTLEPRLYYLYVPTRNQDITPLFDTGYYIFDYDQLFRNNRFSGGDRIGDANQLSLALSSRWMNLATGEENLRLNIGTQVYFQHRKVGYCQGSDCSAQQNDIAIYNTSPINTVSPLVGQAIVEISPNWHVIGNTAWEWQNHRFNNANAMLHYQNKDLQIFNIGYQYQRNVIATTPHQTLDDRSTQQIGSSTVLPINKNWQIVGTFSYNLTDNNPQSYYFGAQYDSCCWALRAIAGRNLTSVDINHHGQYDTAVYFQLLLKGLGTLSSNDPSKILNSQILGYKDKFSKLD